MLERLAAVLARLLTFELIEGGRCSSLPTRPGTDASTIPPCGDDYNDNNDNATIDGGSDKSTDHLEEEGGEEENENTTESEVETPEKNRSLVPPLSDHDGNADRKGGAKVDEETRRCSGGSSGGDGGSSGGGGGGDGERTPTQVARWLKFRTMDLSSFLGVTLLAGDVQAASIAWRRHGRTDRGVARSRQTPRSVEALACAGGRGGGGGVGEDEEGRRLELALPGQLAAVPAGAPPALLGAWLRDEVLPWLDVAGVMAVSYLARGIAWVVGGGGRLRRKSLLGGSANLCESVVCFWTR